MDVLATKFPEAKVFVPDVYHDQRGFFKEIYNAKRYKDAGLLDDFVQDSVSFSSQNVIRGLHYDPAMAKLAQAVRGAVWDVIVDIRANSPAYGTWQGFDLSEHNHHQIYVPAGFAHGFLALTDDVVFVYKHSALYDPAREGAIRWNDPTLAIAWPLSGEPKLSPKDAVAPLLHFAG